MNRFPQPWVSARRFGFNGATLAICVSSQFRLYERSLGGLYEHLDDTVRRSLVAWIGGFTVFHVAGGLIHLLLVFAVISLILHFVTGTRAA